MVIYAIIYSSKPTECSAPRMNPNVNYGFEVTMSQCRFVSCNKYTTLVWGMWEVYFLLSFVVNIKLF